MRSISLDKFNKGLDLRKGASSADADTLRVLKNAYVTEGNSIRKRPGFRLVAQLEAGTIGLSAALGKLNTFYKIDATPSIIHANSLFKANGLNGAGVLASVPFCEAFQGYLYAIEVTLVSAAGAGVHHYLDGGASTLIADVNVPATSLVIKASSKMWAVGNDRDTVRYCKTNDPRNWTEANNAGFLPTGLQSTGSSKSTALGYYNNKLVVFFSDNTQIWTVDVDPAKNLFEQTIDTGTSLPYGHANMAGDVFFFSPQGVRTISAQENTQTNLIDNDVGSPIDRILTVNGFLSDVTKARGQYYRGGGQFWLYEGNKAVVYTFSRSNKVSAWSVYEFPFTLDYVDELDGDLYARSGDSVYIFDRELKTDNGTIFDVVIELPFLDFKSPGILKQVFSMDAVITGTASIAHRFDPRNTSLITNPAVVISGDTRPGTTFPVELLATNIAAVITNKNDQDFELHSLNYYFDTLGLM